MKMKCHATPGAIPPSPNAVSEVEVSDDAYELICDETEAHASCCDHLLGKRMRLILGPPEVVHKTQGWVCVTPEDGETGDGYASFTGVRIAYLRKI
jgi:hypothetical protein